MPSSPACGTPSLLVTGTIGTGKTVVAVESGELIAATGLTAAVVDLDWLAWVRPPSSALFEKDAVHGLVVRNFAAIWPNLRDAGAQRFVLARALTTRAEVDAIGDAIPDGDLFVVRLTATPETIRARLEARDSGATLQEHLAQSVEFDRLLDDARIADATVATDGRGVRDVARAVLAAAGWIDETVGSS